MSDLSPDQQRNRLLVALRQPMTKSLALAAAKLTDDPAGTLAAGLAAAATKEELPSLLRGISLVAALLEQLLDNQELGRPILQEDGTQIWVRDVRHLDVETKQISDTLLIIEAHGASEPRVWLGTERINLGLPANRLIVKAAKLLAPQLAWPIA